MNVYSIPLESITVLPNRQRREHDPVAAQELISSICGTGSGLQNALVCREEDGKTILVSGERRLRALADIAALGGSPKYAGKPLELGFAPVILIKDLSELEAEEAELDENMRRVDLTWQEKISALARLEALRTKQAAVGLALLPTVTSLAQETRGYSEGRAIQETRKELLLAKHLDKPEVKNAKNLDDAFKALKRVEKAERAAALAESVGASYSSDSLRIYNESCIDWMAACPPRTFDVILSDPPYGMGADTFGDSGGLAPGAHAYLDSLEHWRTLMDEFLPETFRITKDQAHMYLFCDIERFPELKASAELCGWQVFRTPLIWFKPAGFRAPWPEHGPQRKYETILYAIKGGKTTLRLGGDVIEASPDAQLGHSAQKPVALYADLLSRSASPGDCVFDPFCGSGPIFPAAFASSITAFGCEIDPSAYGLSLSRIKGLV